MSYLKVDPREAFEAALRLGDYAAAGYHASQIPDPRENLAAMQRLHAQMHQPPARERLIPTETPRMFELKERPALFVKFNCRGENHGDEIEPAADLKFRCNVEQAALDALHPSLRRMFFTKVGQHGADADLDLANAVHDAPNLRATEKLLPPFKWGARFAGYHLRIHIGTSGKQDVVIGDLEFNDLQFTPNEGGTVVLEFRLQGHPDERAAGKLYLLQKKQIDISLTAPQADPAAGIPGAREVVPEPDQAPAGEGEKGE